MFTGRKMFHFQQEDYLWLNEWYEGNNEKTLHLSARFLPQKQQKTSQVTSFLVENSRRQFLPLFVPRILDVDFPSVFIITNSPVKYQRYRISAAHWVQFLTNKDKKEAEISAFSFFFSYEKSKNYWLSRSNWDYSILITDDQNSSCGIFLKRSWSWGYLNLCFIGCYLTGKSKDLHQHTTVAGSLRHLLFIQALYVYYHSQRSIIQSNTLESWSIKVVFSWFSLNWK